MKDNILTSDNESFLQELAAMGLDTKIGLGYNGDIHIYREVLKVSAKAALEKIEKIRKSFECKDYNDYTILVHSIKSSSANIGAMEISNLAKKLENAGINKDYRYIDNNHKEFINQYEFLMNKLADIIDLQDDVQVIEEASVVMSKEDWDIALDKLKFHLYELELDEAEELAKTLMSYSFSVEIKEKLENMIYCLQHFNVESAREKYTQLKALNPLS